MGSVAKVSFVSDRIGNNNEEVLKDKNGNYVVSLGAFNSFNSAGHFYPFYDIVSDLFTSSSSPLLARMANRNLRGEADHPQRLPLMNDIAFTYRINDISTERVSHNILGLDLIETKRPSEVKNSYCNRVVDVIGHIQPEGPFGPMLETSLKNPKVNTAFSVRCFGPITTGSRKMDANNLPPAVNKIIDKFNLDTRVKHRLVLGIITWDYVASPGIASATTDYLKGFKNKLEIRNKLINTDDIKINIFEESNVHPYYSFEDLSVATISTAIQAYENQKNTEYYTMESHNALKDLKDALEFMFDIQYNSSNIFKKMKL